MNLRRQLPPMYFLLATSAALLAFTHFAYAPAWLCVYIPVVLITLALIRLVAWLRPLREEISAEHASRMLRRTEFFASLMSVGFVTWALMLDGYGGAYEHGHIGVFVAVTVMGCIFCLTYLPRAAYAVFIIVLGTFLIYCMASGQPAIMAMGANIALVGLVVLKVLRDSYASFVGLEESRGALEAERAQAQRLSEDNARLAHSDPLTHLPNRRYFFSRLDSMLARDRDRAPFSIGVLDLDRFKPINDTHGHAQGDRLLQAIGDRLRGACGPEVTIARLGGDEFGLIVEGPLDLAESIGQSLCELVQLPVQIGDVTVSVGCSGGLAAWPDAGTTAHALFDRADFALYHAKKARRGTMVRFSAELEQMIRSEQALESALQVADLSKELTLAYQPIVATRSMAPAGVEALARWVSPLMGPVPAEMLFATAERLGMARAVTLSLFDRVLADFDRLPSTMRVSFNLAAPDIADPDTVTALLDRIERTGVRARRLVFEITESSLIADFDSAREALGRLRASGAQIALDDFGTGYSSLSSLHMLPIDIVKIDRSFAVRLDDSVGRRLVGAIRNLARSLSLECVFEGIETEMQLMEATLAGFHYAQGYYIARPAPLDEILEAQLPLNEASAA
ncbi:putative bifunctional diguanylate cyclase/phosphodiesterase [Novosphingobium cyanobacteriorum]|uniref:EAL domain-containing protein n=1 Tax=Novosphingobium cyanobacteriorum TaxID=3024215 RepID=A0ABT6CDF7_9SPHN|nr:EAL domain-containing protein [Novosphingobium cyanobacteriorum]MDF8331961.1 EAL domain-containing protein [Novosphingobium cyanobacteriorum]